MTLLASVALWGSFPATAKLALVDFPPFFLAAVRCTAASCFLLVLLVITRGPFAMLQPAELHSGDFITLLSLSSWAIYTVYGKRVLATYSPLLATTAAYVMGTFLILLTVAVTAPLFPPPRLWSLTAWTIVFYQGILGAVAHIWWYEAVLVVGPSQAAIFTNLQPIIGIVLAPLLLGEQIGIWHVVGTLFVLAGVGLTTRPPSATPETERGESRRARPREDRGQSPGEIRNIESSDADD